MESLGNHLLLCTLFHPAIYGKTNESAPDIEQHYLVYDMYDHNGLSCTTEENMLSLTSNAIESITDIVDMDVPYIFDDCRIINQQYKEAHSKINTSHPTIRNYQDIVSRNNCIQPEIGEVFILIQSKEMVAILKTCWLRIFQRKWRAYIKNRK
jgi:hypothetical protein